MPTVVYDYSTIEPALPIEASDLENDHPCPAERGVKLDMLAREVAMQP